MQGRGLSGVDDDLWIASVAGNIELVDVLLKKGANPNAVQRLTEARARNTALSMACLLGHTR